MESLEKSMHHHLAEYLAGNEAYDDFIDWMYGVIWNIEQRGEPAAAQLGYAIMLAIAELDDDVLTLEGFRDTLRRLAEPATVSL